MATADIHAPAMVPFRGFQLSGDQQTLTKTTSKTHHFDPFELYGFTVLHHNLTTWR